MMNKTMRGYNALKPGMSKIDVDQILRCDGVQHVHSGPMTAYAWQEGMVRIAVTFEHDKLISKSQGGL